MALGAGGQKGLGQLSVVCMVFLHVWRSLVNLIQPLGIWRPGYVDRNLQGHLHQEDDPSLSFSLVEKAQAQPFPWPHGLHSHALWALEQTPERVWPRLCPKGRVCSPEGEQHHNWL